MTEATTSARVDPRAREVEEASDEECWRFYRFLEQHPELPDLLFCSKKRVVQASDLELLLRRLHYRLPNVRTLFNSLRKPGCDYFTMKELIEFKQRLRVSKYAGAFTVTEFFSHLLQRYGSITRAWRRAIDIPPKNNIAGDLFSHEVKSLNSSAGGRPTRGVIMYREWAAFCQREGFQGNVKAAWDAFQPKNGLMSLRELSYSEYRLLTKFYLELKARYDAVDEIWSHVLQCRSEFMLLKRERFLAICTKTLLFAEDEAETLFSLLDLDQVSELEFQTFTELFSFWDTGGCYDVTGAAQALRVRRKRRQLMDAELRESNNAAGGGEKNTADRERQPGATAEERQKERQKAILRKNTIERELAKPLPRSLEDKVLSLGSQEFILNLESQRRLEEFQVFFNYLKKPGRYERMLDLFSLSPRLPKRVFCQTLRQMLYPGDPLALFYSLFNLRILHQRHVQLVNAEDFREVQDRIAPWLKLHGWTYVKRNKVTSSSDVAQQDGGHDLEGDAEQEVLEEEEASESESDDLDEEKVAEKKEKSVLSVLRKSLVEGKHEAAGDEEETGRRTASSRAASSRILHDGVANREEVQDSEEDNDFYDEDGLLLPDRINNSTNSNAFAGPEDPMPQLKKLQYEKKMKRKNKPVSDEPPAPLAPPSWHETGPPSWLEKLGLEKVPDAVILDQEGETHLGIQKFWQHSVLGDMQDLHRPKKLGAGLRRTKESTSSSASSGGGEPKFNPRARTTSSLSGGGSSPERRGTSRSKKTRRKLRKDIVSEKQRKMDPEDMPFVPVDTRKIVNKATWRRMLDFQTGAVADGSGLPPHLIRDCGEDPNLLHLRDFLAFPNASRDVRPQTRLDVELEMLRRTGSLVRGWFEILDPHKSGAIGLRRFLAALGSLNVQSGNMRRVWAQMQPLPDGLGIDLRMLDYEVWLLIGFFATCLFAVFPNVDYLVYYACPGNGCTDTFGFDEEWTSICTRAFTDTVLLSGKIAGVETGSDDSTTVRDANARQIAAQRRQVLTQKLWRCFVPRGENRMHLSEFKILRLWEPGAVFCMEKYPVRMVPSTGKLELSPVDWMPPRVSKKAATSRTDTTQTTGTTTEGEDTTSSADKRDSEEHPNIRLVMDPSVRAEYEQALFELEMLDAQHSTLSNNLRGPAMYSTSSGSVKTSNDGAAGVDEETAEREAKKAHDLEEQSYSLAEFLEFPVNPVDGMARKPKYIKAAGRRFGADSPGGSAGSDPASPTARSKKSVHWVDLDEERRRERTRQKLQAAKNQMFYAANSVRAHLMGHAGKRKGKTHLLSGSGKEGEEEVDALWQHFDRGAKRQIMGSNFAQVGRNKIVDVAKVDDLGDLLDLDPEIDDVHANK
ncbi:unnamed protein product [Amoebophrya sp. A120]|nr:unnamed protein product [Amoebophrya sp. A120]|eukprot:GSA120T00003329001.1